MKKRSKNRKRIILGVTGNLGSGKSTVSKLVALYFKARIIDADRIAHGVIRPGEPVYKRIIRTFGQGIVKKNKTIDRMALAKEAFADRLSVGKLNKITHPEIMRIIKNRIRRFRKSNIIIDAPLLIESGLNEYTDKIIIVKSDPFIRLRRLRRKRPYFEKESLLRRLKFQMPFKRKACLADFVIDNNGAIEETKRQVKAIARRISGEIQMTKSLPCPRLRREASRQAGKIQNKSQ